MRKCRHTKIISSLSTRTNTNTNVRESREREGVVFASVALLLKCKNRERSSQRREITAVFLPLSFTRRKWRAAETVVAGEHAGWKLSNRKLSTKIVLTQA